MGSESNRKRDHSQVWYWNLAKKKHFKEVWQCGVSLSSDDLRCRRNAETMSKGYQLAEESLERSPGLRFSGNKPIWQKIQVQAETDQRKMLDQSNFCGCDKSWDFCQISMKWIINGIEAASCHPVGKMLGGHQLFHKWLCSVWWTGRSLVCPITHKGAHFTPYNYFGVCKKWVGREQLLPLCLSYSLVCSCSFILKGLILLLIAESLPVVPQPIVTYLHFYFK